MIYMVLNRDNEATRRLVLQYLHLSMFRRDRHTIRVLVRVDGTNFQALLMLMNLTMN